MPPDDAPQPVPAEQLRYARLLDLTAKIGFAALVAGFVANATGWLDAHVPAGQLPELWSLPLAEYLVRTGSPTGWGWLAYLRKGEFAGLVGIALIAGCSIMCLAAILPLYVRRRDHVYAGICAAEILVLLLAASGIFAAGH